MTVRGRFGGVLLALLLAALLGAVGYRFYHERFGVEKRDGKVIAGVVTAAFSGRSDLRVGKVDGRVQTRADDVNRLGLRSSLVMKAPFSVDYFVDLSGLSLRDYRWDEESRTLTIRLAPVTIGAPNIDESRRSMARTTGWWVGREAAERLNKRAAVQADGLARAEAEKPEHVRAARERARAFAGSLVRPAFAVAGLDDVRVVALFPDEITRAKADRWDMSRSLQDVLADPKYP